MVCKTTFITKRRAAYSLVELMTASAAGTLVIAVTSALLFFSSRSFVSLLNYVDLENLSRIALDTMSKEIRQANNLASYNSTNLTFTDSDGLLLQYTYDPAGGTLSRVKNGQTKVLLTGCDTLTFGIYQRNPTNNYNVVTTTNAALCKLVQLNWKCSRTIMAAKVNTESVQSAKIVIRKQ